MQCNFVFLTHSMFIKGNKRTPDVSFGERERKIHRDPAGNPSRNLLTTSQTLLPLSHWTHGRGAKASLLITAKLEASADSSCLSLCHCWIHCLHQVQVIAPGVRKIPVVQPFNSVSNMSYFLVSSHSWMKVDLPKFKNSKLHCIVVPWSFVYFN